MDEKKCNTCGEIKPIGEFYTKKSSSRDVKVPSYACKVCERKNNAKYRRVITTCITCKQEKPPNKCNKCQGCNKIYNSKRRLYIKNLSEQKPKDYKKIIKDFTTKMINNEIEMSLHTANDIITYYMWITINPHEYDSYNFNTQINMMFQKLVELNRK